MTMAGTLEKRNPMAASVKFFARFVAPPPSTHVERPLDIQHKGHRLEQLRLTLSRTVCGGRFGPAWVHPVSTTFPFLGTLSPGQT